jgi:hypothetical protein
MNHLLHAFSGASIRPWRGSSVNRSEGSAVRETFHIIGLAVLPGPTFVVNLTVMGFGVRQPERLAGNSRRLRWEDAF